MNYFETLIKKQERDMVVMILCIHDKMTVEWN